VLSDMQDDAHSTDYDALHKGASDFNWSQYRADYFFINEKRHVTVFFCNLADEKEKSLPCVPKSFVSCNKQIIEIKTGFAWSRFL
jgi:hypothetical protein